MAPKRQTIWSFVIPAILLASVVVWVSDPNEPRHQGRRISAWLDDSNLPLTPALAPKKQQAARALREVGPRAVPYIVRRLKRYDSNWNSTYRKLYAKFPPKLAKALPPPLKEFSGYTATDAFFFCGGSTKPVLIAALKDDNATVRWSAAGALGKLAFFGTLDNSNMITALIASLQDSNAMVRASSAFALADVGPGAEAAISFLIPLVHDPAVGDGLNMRGSVRSGATVALGNIGPKAHDAVPALQSLLNDKDPYLRGTAVLALWKIESGVTNTLPLLIKELGQEDLPFKREMVEAVGKMGPQAKAAIPILLSLLSSEKSKAMPDDRCLQRITNALIKIDPATAIRTELRLP